MRAAVPAGRPGAGGASGQHVPELPAGVAATLWEATATLWEAAFALGQWFGAALGEATVPLGQWFGAALGQWFGAALGQRFGAALRQWRCVAELERIAIAGPRLALGELRFALRKPWLTPGQLWLAARQVTTLRQSLAAAWQWLAIRRQKRLPNRQGLRIRTLIGHADVS